MRSTVLGVGVIVLLLQAALANPVPYGIPYVGMIKEDMMADIHEDGTVSFSGEYLFNMGMWTEPRPETCGNGKVEAGEECEEDAECSSDERRFCLDCHCVETPPWYSTMYFPLPPDATDVAVEFNGEPIPWQVSDRVYLTSFGGFEWPSMSFDLTFMEPAPFSIKVEYSHSLIGGPSGKLFLYSMGTGRYVQGWNPPFIGLDISGKPFVDVVFSVKLPPNYRVNWCQPQSDYVHDLIVDNTYYWLARSYQPTADFVMALEEFTRGDTNSTGSLDIADAVFTLSYLFASGPAPTCMDTAELNGDGHVDISDPIFLVMYLFQQGVAPVEAKPGCRMPDEAGQLTGCGLPGDCILVPADCCGCEQGGRSIAISESSLDLWLELTRRRCEGVDCASVNVCASLKAECADGHCQAVASPN